MQKINQKCQEMIIYIHMYYYKGKNKQTKNNKGDTRYEGFGCG